MQLHGIDLSITIKALLIKPFSLFVHVCQDYLMALSLQQEQQSQDLQWEQLPEGISDLELAKKLQEEEDRRASQYYQEQEQEQAAADAAAAAAAQAQVGREGLREIEAGGGGRRCRTLNKVGHLVLHTGNMLPFENRWTCASESLSHKGGIKAENGFSFLSFFS